MAGHVGLSNAVVGALRTTPCKVVSVQVSATAASVVSIYNGASNAGPPIYEMKCAAQFAEYVDLPDVPATALFIEATGTVTGVIGID